MSKVAVSFTHIIKSGELAFGVLVSRFILGETFPASVYLSMIPIIAGCALSLLTELNFNKIVIVGLLLMMTRYDNPVCSEKIPATTQ
ncbi:unnamed protein product [Cochlearia groenlandica]